MPKSHHTVDADTLFATLPDEYGMCDSCNELHSLNKTAMFILEAADFDQSRVLTQALDAVVQQLKPTRSTILHALLTSTIELEKGAPSIAGFSAQQINDRVFAIARRLVQIAESSPVKDVH